MKRGIACFLALVLLCLLVACGGDAEAQEAADEISRLTGEKVSAAQVREMLDEYGELGMEMTAEELVELYELGAGLAEELGVDPSAAPDPSAGAAGTYAAAYTFYTGLADALARAVNDAVDANNARLETEQPDSYYNDPSYMLLIYMPFVSMDMAFTATFTDTVSPAGVESAFALMGTEDAQFSTLGPGRYQVTYTGSDWRDEAGSYAGRMEASYEPERDRLRFVSYRDGEVGAFYEFISLGGDRYALQDRTNRAIVTYRDGQVTQLLHAQNKYEENWETGEPEPWSVAYSLETDSIWTAQDLDDSWVRALESSGALAAIYELRDGALTITMQKSVLDWETGESRFEPQEPIVIPAA